MFFCKPTLEIFFASVSLIFSFVNLLLSETVVIVYVWSQYDGANIEQRLIGHGWRQNQEVKLKIVGGVKS